MKGKVNFILGVHNHIPNGTAEEEAEALYNYKIRPLVSALYQFPRINVVFHYSGVLLHWIERHHPELFVLLEDLLGRKQAEFLGGGFYEPMMPLLPLADRIGQIEMLTTYLRRQFGKRPQGCWLPDFTWEQNLVGPLGACGMSYAFLDESYFFAARPGKDNWHEPCITEDQGKIITVFPVFSSLGEENPLVMMEKFLASEGAGPSGEGPVTVFPAFSSFGERGIASGEKVEAEYLHFFEELSGADSRIEFTLPSRLFRNLRGLEKLYFTGNSGASEKGFPITRRFLTDYPEAGLIYAKMIHTRVLINQLRGDKARKHAALEELWKAQDSAVFSPSGLGNTPVRKAAYRALLEAENITRGKGSFSPSLSAFDYDLDGEDEYVFKDEKLNGYIKLQGAFLFELDYFPKAWNYLDTYIPGEKTRRGAFADYLVPGETLPEITWQGIPGARFCGAEAFQTAEFDRLHRQVSFRLPPKEGVPLGNLEIKKTWNLKQNILTLRYEIKNTGPNAEGFTLVPLTDLSFSGGNGASVRLLALRGALKEKISPGDAEDFFVKDAGGVEFRDVRNEVVLSLESSGSFDARIFSVTPRESGCSQEISPSEYQFMRVMPLLPVSIESGMTWETGFSLKISS